MSQTMLLLAMSLASILSRGLAIDCYSCVSTINELNTETSANGKACSTLADTATSTGNDYCITSYGSSTTYLGVSSTFTRSGSKGNQTNECSYDKSVLTCYCTTDKCNSDVITTPTSLSCYQCNSVDYMDNGCGAVLNSNSKFVQQVVGCSACGKTISVGSDYVTRYSRGCARSVNTDSMCHGPESSRVCICKTGLCNSAQGIRLTGLTLMVAAILSTVKSFC